MQWNDRSHHQEKSLTLFELNQLVREVIEISLDGEYWVEAELSEIREVRGHCYMELVQKDVFGNTPVARASAKCWKNTWMALRPRFERVTGQPLRAGMKLLLRVSANFHEAYGFSWIVSNIDPDYTMGDMARKRQEIVRILKEEGVFDLQKELELPLFAQRVAVISSEQAAGYGDFYNQLVNNDLGVVFQVTLFSAIMQGEQVEESIIHSLDQINVEADAFDVVVIIRGGGATADLSGFDTLALAENVANFPLPVITGIGHDRDESVLDMVAYQHLKTPTAVAAFLVDHIEQVVNRLDDCQQTILRYVTHRMDTERLRLTSLAEKVPVLFRLMKSRQTAALDALYARLTTAMSEQLSTERHRLILLAERLHPLSERRLTNERHRLQMLEQRSSSLDPALLLRRGYSITTKDGHVVRQASELKSGDILIPRLEKGTTTSKVIKS